jgi:hypothetical protein
MFVFATMEYFMTEEKFNAVVWTPRIAGSVSALGSLLTLTMISRSGEPKHRNSVYHRIVAGMAFYDLIFSIGWAWGQAAVPKETGLTYAYGNTRTCTAIGFFMQFGFGSFFYSAFLTSYYLRVGNLCQRLL